MYYTNVCVFIYFYIFLVGNAKTSSLGHYVYFYVPLNFKAYIQMALLVLLYAFPLNLQSWLVSNQHLKATNLSSFPKFFYHFSQRPTEHLPFCFTALLFPANFPERASYTCILQFLPSDAMLGFYNAGSSISTCLKMLFKGHQLLP